ncbi:MAG: efflux transporter periplasmic adaptor subunit, partial [Burkholderiaceae bacterium]|nr:efflux transporter periplasmic adaptor subunit [Burkholderiaceae bacterium]
MLPSSFSRLRAHPRARLPMAPRAWALALCCAGLLSACTEAPAPEGVAAPVPPILQNKQLRFVPDHPP